MIQVQPLTLSFTQEQRDIEPDFLATFFAKNLVHLRFCHFFSILFLAAWSYVDVVCYANMLFPFLMIKFLLIIPVFLVGFVFTYSKYYKTYYNIISAIYVVLIGSSFNYMMIITRSQEIYPLVIATTFIFISNYTFIRLKFTHAAIAGLTVLGMTTYTLLIQRTDLSSQVQITCIYYVFLVNLLGLLISYSMERSSRREYYLGRELQKERDNQVALNSQLQSSLNEIKQLRNIIPICAHCKKIRDDNGYWQQVKKYISDHTNTTFSHGICEECSEKLYGNEAWYKKM